MSRWTVAVGWVVLVGLAGQAHAELHCAEAVHDAGRLRGGVRLTHTFLLVNAGTGPVEVTRVRPGCGCLAPRLDRRTFAPGERGRLVLEVNTVTQPAGPNAWRVTIHYRAGPQEHELLLAVTAEVVREVFLQPASLLLSRETAAGHPFTLTEKRNRPLAIRFASVSSAHVRTRVSEPTRQPDGSWVRTVHLEVLPTCPVGRHEDVLHLRTNDETFADLEVPFTVLQQPRGVVTATPAEVQLHGTRSQGFPARIVLLSAAGDGTVRIAGVESDHPAIRCTFAPGPGPRATLRIQVEKEKLAGQTSQGQLRVHLAEPAGQTVTVPVRWELRND
jgi:hypothetical protein